MARRVQSSEENTVFYRRPPAKSQTAPEQWIIPAERHIPRPTARRRLWLGLFLLAALFGFLIAAAVAVVIQGRIMPGVHTVGVNLGGMQADEARATLAQSWNSRRLSTLRK